MWNAGVKYSLHYGSDFHRLKYHIENCSTANEIFLHVMRVPYHKALEIGDGDVETIPITGPVATTDEHEDFFSSTPLRPTPMPTPLALSS